MKKSQIIIAVALSAMLLVGCKHKEKEKSLPDYSGVSIPTIEESLYNHMLVFATEQARKTNTIVDVQKFIENYF